MSSALQRVATTVLLVSATFAPAALATSAPTFRRVDFPNQIREARVAAINDVNGDGHLDLIAFSFGALGLYVLPGNGTTDFSNWYRANDDVFSASTIDSSDFNNDGHLDFAISGSVGSGDTRTSFTRVYLGESDGHWRRVFETDGGTVLTGDVNGDGAPDLVVLRYEYYSTPAASGYRNVMATYLGDGAGGFSAAGRSVFGDMGFGWALTLADVNGDGRADALGNAGALLANATGGFQTPIPLIKPPLPSDALDRTDVPFFLRMTSGDLNGDGRIDLLARFRYTARSVGYKWGETHEFTSMYFGDGTGSFGPPVRLAEPEDHQRAVVEPMIADVNGDGRSDIVLTGPNSFEDSSPLYGIYAATDVYLGTGGGLFSGPILSPISGGLVSMGATRLGGQLYDVDGDGWLDLVTEFGDGLQIARGDGTGHFAPRIFIGAFDFFWAPGGTVGDFNGDGEPDVAVGNFSTANVSVWLGDGTGDHWSGPTQYKLGERETPVAIVAADFTGDGKLDLATASDGELGAPGVSVLDGDGVGHFTLTQQMQFSAPSTLAAADFDGDGTMELAVADNDRRRVQVFFDIGAAMHSVTMIDPIDTADGSFNVPANLAAADFDGNGLVDLARSGISDVISVFMNIADPAQRRVVRVGFGAHVRGVAAGDITGDGIADLLAPNYSSNPVGGMLLLAAGSGTGSFATPSKSFLGAGEAPFTVALGDFDGAGQRGALVDYNSLQLLMADGAGGLRTPTQVGYANRGLLRHIELADVNHDGRLDIIRSTSVMLNLGTCGNGKVEGTEECDDGNSTDCDGCSAACKTEVGFRCGDAIVNAACGEQCDAGEANSNTADTCRTNCRTPRCGDGILDSGEACDDGNTTACDGCSPSCTPDPAPVCGDGVVNTACGEICDDGNQVTGDGCSRCRPEFIPGGGVAKTDCITEWIVTNPNNNPRYDKRGRFSRQQTCRDNDPSCDFDGGVSGACTFHVAMCVNVEDSDLPTCHPATLAGYRIVTPTAGQAKSSTVVAGLRAQLDTMVDGMLSQPAGTCSATTALTIPIGSRTVRIRASTVSHKQDTDALKFTCTP